jgi:addiction module HigA family antidote
MMVGGAAPPRSTTGIALSTRLSVVKMQCRNLMAVLCRSIKMDEKLPPIHPGEILMEEFLKPMNISQYKLAKDISVPPRRINEIVHGVRAITPDTALRLSRYFGLSERFWINMQTRYDLEVEKDRLQDRLDKEVHVYAVAA